MNYLAHIALAGDNPEYQVGGLLGDFVRGPLIGKYSPAIEAVSPPIANSTPMWTSSLKYGPSYSALATRCGAMPEL